MSEFKQNCSLCEECDGLSQLQRNGVIESLLLKLCQFIFVFSIVIALHLLNILVLGEFKLENFRLSKIKVKLRSFINIISLSLLILTLPFITIIITLALLYKVLCSVAIKRKDRRFVKFLDSFDVFCCLEDNSTTDIQGVIQSNTIELAVDKIKEKLRNVFINHGTDKIFYRRNEEYGFYYWRRYSSIDLAQYVQITEIPETIDKITEQNLRRVDNQIVSYNDEGLFKVLIMKNKEVDDGKDEHKIILKFHHSVKDAALIEFVARLVEKADDCQITLVSTPQSQDYNSPDALMNMITKLYDILASSINDNSSWKKQDKTQSDSITHMNTLKWTRSDENLLCKVKYFRDNVNDFNLSDKLGDALDRVWRKLER